MNSIKIEDLVLELKQISNNFEKNTSNNASRETNEQQLAICNRELERFIIKSRYFLTTPPRSKKTIDDFDKTIAETLNIKIYKDFIEDDSDFIVYRIDIPIIIPSKKHTLSKDIVCTAVNYAKRQYEKHNNVNIIPIGHPAIIIINQTSDETEQINRKFKYLKDVDNYQTKPFLDSFQGTFYGDDRFIETLIQLNKTNCSETKSTIHILPSEYLIDYLSIVY